LTEDRVARRFDDRGQPRLSLLRPPSLAEVTHAGAEPPGPSLPERGHRESDRELLTAAVERRHLDPPAEDRTPAGRQKTGDPAAVLLPQRRRNDQVREILTDRSCRRPPEYGFGVGVPARDPSGGVHGDDGVERGVKDALEPAAAGRPSPASVTHAPGEPLHEP